MRNLLTLIVATTILSGAAFAQPAPTGVATTSGSVLTTKDGSAVQTMHSTKVAEPVAKPVAVKHTKKKHRAKKMAKKPVVAPKTVAPAPVAPATAQ
jgi:hypothetical protein